MTYRDTFHLRKNARALLLFLLCIAPFSHAFELSLENTNFTTSPTFSSVEDFRFLVDVDEDLALGEFSDPMLNLVDYQVRGTLVSGTPSGFSAFDLMREIDGVDFYAQGSSLWFEVAAGANLSDGLQDDELVPNSEGEIFIFNGREIGNGRFHPALFVLNADGTGRIQNSNNVPVTGEPEVAFGSEYITDLSFEQGSLTLVEGSGGSGGGASPAWLIALGLLYWLRSMALGRWPKRKHHHR